MVDFSLDAEVAANIADGLDATTDQNTMQIIGDIIQDLNLQDTGQAVLAVAESMSPEAQAALNRAAASSAYYAQQANIAARSPSFSDFEAQQAADRAQAAAQAQADIVAAAASAAAARAAAERAQQDAWIAEQQASAQAAAQARSAAREQFLAEQQASAQAAAQAQAAAREAEISRLQEQTRIALEAQSAAQRPVEIASALDEHVKQLRALGYNVIVKVL